MYLGLVLCLALGQELLPPLPSPPPELRAQREENAVCSGQQDRVVGRKELFTLACGGEGLGALETTKRACGVSLQL